MGNILENPNDLNKTKLTSFDFSVRLGFHEKNVTKQKKDYLSKTESSYTISSLPILVTVQFSCQATASGQELLWHLTLCKNWSCFLHFGFVPTKVIKRN